MDIGTISVVVLMGMLVLLAIGMPLGFASGFLAVVVMAMKFGRELLFSSFGTAPLNSLSQRIYGITTSYMLVSVPLFSFMANVLERSGIARDMYDTLEKWMNLTRGGIAVLTALMEGGFAWSDRTTADVASGLRSEPCDWYDLRIWFAGHHRHF